MTDEKTKDNKLSGGKTYEEKPEEKKKKKKKKITCKSIIESVYDKSEGTFLGRTPKDWILLLVFFFFFYTILFGYFALLLSIFIKGILTDNVPFRTGESSIIGLKPGVNIRPTLVKGSNTLDFKNYNVSLASYIKSGNSFLDEFIPTAPGGIQCTDAMIFNNLSQTCIFKRTDLGQCSDLKSETDGKRFCIFLKINTIYGWLPDIDITQSKNIMINCTTNNNTLTQALKYYPSSKVTGFNGGEFANYYYPFLNKNPQWVPIVAVEFPNIFGTPSVTVQCSTVNLKNVLPTVKFEFKF